MTCARIVKSLWIAQSKFMAAYIQKNTELRQKAKTKAEKDFFELMNNACFGKKWKVSDTGKASNFATKKIILSG